MDKAQAAEVLRRDQELNHRFPARPGGPLKMSVSPEAVANAVRTEGPEVLGADGEGYWKDMRRRYPHLDMNPDKHVSDRVSRFGKATLRKRGGRWQRWVNGAWREDRGAGRNG